MAFAGDVLAGFGVATLLLGCGACTWPLNATLKRMLAYSSVEHMGILAIGMSFASPLAVAGVLLHVLAHAAAKGTAFFGAGSVVRKLRTKDLERIRGAMGLLPGTALCWSRPCWACPPCPRSAPSALSFRLWPAASQVVPRDWAKRCPSSWSYWSPSRFRPVLAHYAGHGLPWPEWRDGPGQG